MNNFTFGDETYQYYEDHRRRVRGRRDSRRHGRGPDAHDQLLHDRPRGRSNFGSRCASEEHSIRVGRVEAVAIGGATGRSVACAF